MDQPSTSSATHFLRPSPNSHRKLEERRPTSYRWLHNFLFGSLLTILLLKVAVITLTPIFYGRTVEVNGEASKEFDSVREAFRQNFLDGLERDGASLAVYHRGKPVVNLFAGNSGNHRSWTPETRNLLFSVSKAVSSLCVALLVDRGHLHWDDLVVKYWPEYGANGKNTTTIQHALSHQAGLPYIDEPIYYDDALGLEGALNKIARSKPIWKPGTESGYHPLTWGWIVDGIVKHADPKHRHLSQFFKEEIANKFDLDMSIGAESPKDFRRTAVITNPTPLDFLRDTVSDLRMLVMLGAYYAQPSNSIVAMSMKNPSWLALSEARVPFNSYAIQRLPLGAVNGLSGAHDLARLFSLLLNGSLVSGETFEEMRRPTLDTWHIERTVLYPLMKGHGFFYDYHPTKADKFVFGHPGYGCQSLHVDPEEELVIVYLTNGLKSATSILCRPYQNLVKAVYRQIQT